MELPPYRMPVWRSVLITVRDRCLLFLQKAGTVILAISIVLWFLASLPQGRPEAMRALEAEITTRRSGGRHGAAQRARAPHRVGARSRIPSRAASARSSSPPSRRSASTGASASGSSRRSRRAR